MAEERTYDVVVVGGGSTGENVAGYVREHDLSVVLVEAELVGGECSYWACMPSKALLRPGEVLAAARRVPAAAQAVTGEVDAERAFSTRDAFTSDWDDDAQAAWVESTGTALVRGHARLTGERRVEVRSEDGGAVTLHADRAVVIATGTRAMIPPIEGLDEIELWDNRDVTAASEVPERLLVLGGGVVGVEMAQAYRRLGAGEVTIVEMRDRLLTMEEPFVGEELRGALEQDGVVVLTDATAVRASRDGAGEVHLFIEDGTELVGDELLVATGREPRTDDLGLENVGLEPGGYLDVDDELRVEAVAGGWLYAAGDVNGRALLTHQGKYQARLVGDRLGGMNGEIWPGRGAWADHEALPRVVFTDPQVAAVGRTQQQAADAGLPVRVVSYGIGQTAGGALEGEGAGGTAKLVIHDERDVIVGATFVGPDVGEMLHAATIAIVGEVPLPRLWHAVPAFPTASEVWLRLLETDRGVG